MAELIPGLRDQLQLVALLILAAMGLWKGAGPERAVAGVFLGMLISSRIYSLVFGNFINLVSIDYGRALIDLAAMIAFAIIALRANRMYTLWIAALQLIAFNAHLARELTQSMTPIAYAILYVGPSYFQLLIQGLGLWAHRRRVARFGPYRSWIGQRGEAAPPRGSQWRNR
ncbi:hypothetical protein [Allopontixanthobacter sp.]|uniref:hypothetical protein n=1 Tax=Allopontixanthobacter sp. TaxID=2906452 RepID=UPI002AB98EA6|nr:hypothetical protein [Allopontixanthobacter sp.]MDZ4307603.1 hypothetical protein [Allopontixanthobacter sp.]